MKKIIVRCLLPITYLLHGQHFLDHLWIGADKMLECFILLGGVHQKKTIKDDEALVTSQNCNKGGYVVGNIWNMPLNTSIFVLKTIMFL